MMEPIDLKKLLKSDDPEEQRLALELLKDYTPQKTSFLSRTFSQSSTSSDTGTFKSLFKKKLRK
ncbi:MAG: hypothetical protein CMF48_04735 [Legionellales bacterium]|nr:hypothetical protein [Legionellales bacterium]